MREVPLNPLLLLGFLTSLILIVSCHGDSDECRGHEERIRELREELNAANTRVIELEQSSSHSRVECPTCPQCPTSSATAEQSASAPDAGQAVAEVIEADLMDLSISPDRYQGQTVRVTGVLCMCASLGFCHMGNNRSACSMGQGATITLSRADFTPEEAWRTLLSTRIDPMRPPTITVDASPGPYGLANTPAFGVRDIVPASARSKRR